MEREEDVVVRVLKPREGQLPREGPPGSPVHRNDAYAIRIRIEKQNAASDHCTLF